MRCSSRRYGRRWAMFNAVGIAGLLFQLACLAILKHGLGLHYLVATVVAIELTILHNFSWHVRWTWADRPVSRASLMRRLVRFHLTNGAVSLAGSVVVMAGLVEIGHLNYLVANVIAVAVCALANFVLSDRVVFAPAVCAALLSLVAAAPANAADLHAGRGDRIRSICASHRSAAGQGDERSLAVSLDRPAAGGAAGAGAGETSPRGDRRQPAANARWRRRGEVSRRHVSPLGRHGPGARRPAGRRRHADAGLRQVSGRVSPRRAALEDAVAEWRPLRSRSPAVHEEGDQRGPEHPVGRPLHPGLAETDAGTERQHPHRRNRRRGYASATGAAGRPRQRISVALQQLLRARGARRGHGGPVRVDFSQPRHPIRIGLAGGTVCHRRSPRVAGVHPGGDAKGAGDGIGRT